MSAVLFEPHILGNFPKARPPLSTKRLWVVYRDCAGRFSDDPGTGLRCKAPGLKAQDIPFRTWGVSKTCGSKVWMKAVTWHQQRIYDASDAGLQDAEC